MQRCSWNDHGCNWRVLNQGHINRLFQQRCRIEIVAVIFMLVGSIPFILYVQGFQGDPWRIFKNSQVRVFPVPDRYTHYAIAWVLASPIPDRSGEEHSACRCSM